MFGSLPRTSHYTRLSHICLFTDHFLLLVLRDMETTYSFLCLSRQKVSWKSVSIAIDIRNIYTAWHLNMSRIWQNSLRPFHCCCVWLCVRNSESVCKGMYFFLLSVSMIHIMLFIFFYLHTLLNYIIIINVSLKYYMLRVQYTNYYHYYNIHINYSMLSSMFNL